MDLKTAYQIMGLDDDATMDQLDEQYMLWIRKEKAQRNQMDEGSHSDDEVINMDEITEAYYLIKNKDQPIASEVGAKEKIKHFIYYYKFHTIGILLLVIFVGALVYSIIDGQMEKARIANLPTPDMEILILGNYHVAEENHSLLEEAVQEEFPEWENVKVTVEQSSVGADTDVNLDYANRPVLLLTLREEEPDVYLVDESHFEIVLDYELYAPLNIDDDLKAETEEHALKFGQLEGENEQLYGVNIATSDILHDMGIENDEVIASIRKDSPKQENALAFIERVLQEK